jgi:hypothetical protein
VRAATREEADDAMEIRLDVPAGVALSHEATQLNVYLLSLTDNHMVHTKCGQGHSRKSLCCKMNQEFDFFLSTSKK